MKILRPFDSLKFVRVMFVAVACIFAISTVYSATLPAGYTELEYIESTGTQYIDTRITDIVNLKTELVAQLTDINTSTSSYPTLIGANGSSSQEYKVVLGYHYGSSFYSQVGGSAGYKYFGNLDTNKHTFIVDNGLNSQTIRFDDTTYTSNYAITTDQTVPLTIFARKTAGSVGSYTNMKVWSVKFWHNNIMIRNFVPARRDSDGVLGMYDLADVNPATAFYTNAGTGEFIAGEYKIKIATTRYNEQQFTQVETDLNAARTAINDLITQMQTNAVNVSKLAVEKQTRPNATCPAGKNCLLVTDPTGAENWYVIAGADDVETASTIPDYFSFTTTALNAGDSVSFNLNPSGTFTVDWGDGSTPQVIERTNPFNSDEADYENSRYTHTYANAGPKTIKITGRATGYSTDIMMTGVLLFENTSQIASIDGCLGAIFPTLGNGEGQQPRFNGTFANTQITSIPENLFRGVTGATEHMFDGTFFNTKITSIPAGLFSSVTGAADYMFYDTFYRTQITSIPENLFSGITGAADAMFAYTFQRATITSIPENLFRGVTGAAGSMFSGTFANTQITSIPAGLFSGVTGAAPGMFQNTFQETRITSIPAGLFSGVRSAADYMFAYTFSGCPNLTGYIPESTFAGLIQNNSPDADDFMSNIFGGATSIATTCPQNTTEVSTPYKSAYWSTDNGNAVMCRPN